MKSATVIPIKLSPPVSRGLPAPPRDFTSEAKHLWRAVLTRWVLDPAALVVLDMYCRALMTKRAAAALIRRHGLLVTDRWGQLRANPAAAVERDADQTMLRCCRTLHLDLEPLHDAPGRPGAED